MEAENSFDTLLQHFAEEDQPFGAITPPIYQSSLFSFERFDDWVRSMREHPEGPPYHYSRVSNPNLDILERKIAILEKADRAKAFSSGMAAISAALMHCLESGGHVVAVDACYGPVRAFLSNYLSRFGVATTYVDGLTPESVIDAIKPETRAVYLESPSSLIYRLQDFEAITRVCRQKRVLTIADNSYSSPVFQNPASMGVDMVVHSATKYLGGHSDITAGVVCLSNDSFDRFLREDFTLLGAALGPFQAWLMLRGMRTLSIRMRQHESTANRVAGWLRKSGHASKVFHVSLPDFPQRELYLKQMRGSSGLISFIPKNQDEAFVKRFVEGLKIFKLGVSWGGFESLVVALKLDTFLEGMEGWIVRLFCGLEDAEDLVRDLDQALRTAEG